MLITLTVKCFKLLTVNNLKGKQLTRKIFATYMLSEVLMILICKGLFKSILKINNLIAKWEKFKNKYLSRGEIQTAKKCQ